MVKQVKAVIPKEVIDANIKGEDVSEAVVNSVVEASLEEKTVDEQVSDKSMEAVGVAEGFLSSRANALDDKHQKKLKKEQSLRIKMIATAMGVSSKDLLAYCSDYVQFQQGATRLTDDRMTRLKRNRGIYKVQHGANKNDFKDTTFHVIKSISIMSVPSLLKMAGISFVLPPWVTIGATVTSLAYSVYRYNKRKMGNLADENAKQEGYEVDLNSFVEDMTKLNQVMDRDKAFLEQKKRELSRREYKKFREEYLHKVVSELGIESPFQTNPEVQKTLQEFPESMRFAHSQQRLVEMEA